LVVASKLQRRNFHLSGPPAQRFFLPREFMPSALANSLLASAFSPPESAPYSRIVVFYHLKSTPSSLPFYSFESSPALTLHSRNLRGSQQSYYQSILSPSSSPPSLGSFANSRYIPSSFYPTSLVPFQSSSFSLLNYGLTPRKYPICGCDEKGHILRSHWGRFL
jgi:hypothetical protein